MGGTMSVGETVLFAEERKHCIVELLKQRKKIIIPELCSHFGVSASTVRNDLRDLQKVGLLTRTHGGAIINSKSGFEPLPTEKQTQMLEAKQAIARAAVRYIEDGDIIAVVTGTTTFEMIKLLGEKRGLTVILNDIFFASYLEQFDDINVIVVGGTLRKKFHYLQMPPDASAFDQVNIDKIFISCNGVHPTRGITTPDPVLAHDIRLMVDASAELYVICDSSKIGSVSFSRIVDISSVFKIITDDNIEHGDAEELHATEVNLEIVSCHANTC
jgi:DeoR family fructose operon transcriptional repressor